MNGLEKIIGKIIEEANAEADKIKLSADAEIADINHESDEIISRIRQITESQTEREIASIMSRANSNAEMAHRAAILEAKSSMLDNVYQMALHTLISLNENEYRNLLINLLTAACKERIQSAGEIFEQYGELDENGTNYTVIMNQKDLKKHGNSIIDGALKNLRDVNSEITLTLDLENFDNDMEGGLILVCGGFNAETISINCSLSMIVNSLRDEFDSEIYQILFA